MSGTKWLAVATLTVGCFASPCFGQQLTPLQPLQTQSQQEKDTKTREGESALDRLSAAARKLEKQQTFEMEYKFEEGQVLLWDAEQVFTTDVRKGPDEGTTAARSRSVMQWRVTDVDSLGQATVVLTINSSVMWQQKDQDEPTEYDSEKDRRNPPPIYKSMDEQIGLPLATYTLDKYGRVVDRKETFKDIKMGFGHFTLPLPAQAVRVGDRWHSPDSILVTMPEGNIKEIKTRIEYRLQRIEDGIAHVSVDTQVLTPVDEVRVQSQLLQQLSKGYIKFDMQKGSMIEKRLNWDEKCIGFAGPESSLAYLSKYTFQLKNQQNDADSPATLSRKSLLQSRIRLADDGPVLRW